MQQNPRQWRTRAGALAISLAFGVALAPSSALAWGYEGHEVIAAIARAYMTPAVRAKVDAMLAADDTRLNPHDMVNEATWADSYRRDHRETASWHFVDLEIDRPDMKVACFGYPSPGPLASRGPAQDCLVNKIEEFTKELADPVTEATERLFALKYVLHLVGDLHQPLHASDNHDHGGNCVLLALGGPQTQNLHSYWDTGLIREDGLRIP